MSITSVDVALSATHARPESIMTTKHGDHGVSVKLQFEDQTVSLFFDVAVFEAIHSAVLWEAQRVSHGCEEWIASTTHPVASRSGE